MHSCDGDNGGVSWKFGNNNHHRDSNCVVSSQFGVGRQRSENNMADSDSDERCIKPSMMKGIFAGEGNGHVNGANGKESPKVPVKKKRTTFTWIPAKKEDLDAKDGGASDATMTNTTGNVCDSIDSGSNPEVKREDKASSTNSNSLEKEAVISNHHSNSDHGDDSQHQNGACNIDINPVDSNEPCKDQPNEDVKPNEDVQPNEEVKPNEDVQPNEEVKPNEDVLPNEKVQPNEEVGDDVKIADCALDANANPTPGHLQLKWQSFDSQADQDSLNDAADMPNSEVDDDSVLRRTDGEEDNKPEGNGNEVFDDIHQVDGGDEDVVHSTQDVVKTSDGDEQGSNKE